MLNEITIENVAVIEKASAVFGDGFNVLTGETGAGKSILIDSINAILGNRTSRDIVRSGAAKASIWATFSDISPNIIAQLESAGYPSDGELLLYREISVDGKSSCRINGMPATAGILKDICSGLIHIHGQHDNHSLLNPLKHIGILDLFAQNEALLAEYKEEYHKLMALRREIDKLSVNESEKERKMDLLRYELEEIEGADLTPGEEEELEEKRQIIRHSQRIMEALNLAYMALSGGEEGTGAVGLLGEAGTELTEAAGYATDLASYAEQLNDLYYTASEISSDIQNNMENYIFDSQELDEVESRIDTIYRLKQKYGGSIEDIITYGGNARDELEGIEFSAERLEILQKNIGKLTDNVKKLADDLSETRTKAFDRLSKDISSALDFLNMPGIQMSLERKEVAFGQDGQDEIEFFIATNPGETPKPLAKIASGGELSRIMLALKSALAERDDLATVIYDEIDTGISGLAAGRIGRMLHDTSLGRQVICVTHTAQVAAYASRHLLIEKQVEDGRTFTHIRELVKEERVEELARIISGDTISEISLANAREMLHMSENNVAN